MIPNIIGSRYIKKCNEKRCCPMCGETETMYNVNNVFCYRCGFSALPLKSVDLTDELEIITTCTLCPLGYYDFDLGI